MRNAWLWLVVVIAAWAAWAACGTSQPGAPLPPDARPRPSIATADPAMMRPAPRVNAADPMDGQAPGVRVVSKDVLMVGEIRVDLAAARAEVPARIALDRGILEFLAVQKGGKSYESLLELDAPALAVQVALLLSGLAPGELVRLAVRGAAGDERPAGALLLDREKGAPLGDVAWKFTGSDVQDGRFAAAATRSIVAIWPDPSAIINPTVERQNPYRGPALGFEVAPGGLAPGTPVTLVISKISKEAAK